MRILHVHSGNIFGGVERIMIALTWHREFSPEFEHVFALTYAGRLARELVAAGSEVFLLPQLRLSRPWEVARARAGVRALLRNIRPDLAVVHSAWSQIAFAKTIQSAGIPLIFYLVTEATGRGVVERIAQLRFPDHILSISKAADSTAHRLFPGVPSSVVYSPLAVDEAAFARVDRTAIRQSLGAGEDQVVILQASRLEGWKGHRELIRTLMLLRENPRWTCWIAGGGEPEYLAELKSLARELPRRIHFLGERSDIPQLMIAADIYTQPNVKAEGYGVAFVEAGYARLPVVTSNIGAAMEVVDASSGILVSPGNLQGFTSAFEKLIEDSQLRRRMGEAGRARVLAQCDPRAQFSKLEAVFRKVAHG